MRSVLWRIILGLEIHGRRPFPPVRAPERIWVLRLEGGRERVEEGSNKLGETDTNGNTNTSTSERETRIRLSCTRTLVRSRSRFRSDPKRIVRRLRWRLCTCNVRYCGIYKKEAMLLIMYVCMRQTGSSRGRRQIPKAYRTTWFGSYEGML